MNETDFFYFCVFYFYLYSIFIQFTLPWSKAVRLICDLGSCIIRECLVIRVILHDCGVKRLLVAF